MIKKNRNLVNKIIAIISGVLIPIFLIASIPVIFKSTLKPEKQETPIVLEMMALQMPKQKPVNKEKPKTEEKKIEPNPVKKVTPKKTILAKVEPEEKIPELKKAPLEKVVDKPQKKVIVKKNTVPDLPMPVPIFKLTAAPQFLHKESLIYPEVMRSSGITGIVKLAVLIGKEGKVYRVTILKSAGEAFDKAAKQALLASTFIPAKIGDRKVAVELRLPVRFRLL